MPKYETITREDIEKRKKKEQEKRDLIKKRAEEAAKKTKEVVEKVPKGSLFGRAAEEIKKRKKRLKDI